MKRSMLSLPALVVLVACTSTPNALITYKKAKPNVSVTLTQLLTCDPDYTKIFQSARVTVATTHTAGDASATPIEIKKFDGFLRNGDLSFKFYPDGRLNSINANVTGTGEATINSIASVIGSVFGLGAGGPKAMFEPRMTEIEAVCQVINQGNAKKNEVMTLTYNNEFKENSLASATGDLLPDNKTELYLGMISKNLSDNDLSSGNLIDSVTATFFTNEEPFSPISFPVDEAKSGKASEYVSLNIQKTQKYIISVARIFNAGLNLKVEDSEIPDSSTTAASSQTETVQIPKGAAFGTSKFSMTLNEMGAISAIGYNSTRGGSSALNTVNSGLQNFQQKTDKEVADNIAQQARRLRCEADPTNCV